MVYQNINIGVKVNMALKHIQYSKTTTTTTMKNHTKAATEGVVRHHTHKNTISTSYSIFHYINFFNLFLYSLLNLIFARRIFLCCTFESVSLLHFRRSRCN